MTINKATPLINVEERLFAETLTFENVVMWDLYGKDECVREEEVVELETPRTMLQFDVAAEAGELVETPDADSERESLDEEEI